LVSYTNWLASYGISSETWSQDQDTDHDGISDANEFLLGTNPTVPDSADPTVMTPDIYQDVNGDKYFEISYDRPAGIERRNAYYTAYLTDHLPSAASDWGPGLFNVVNITSLSATAERVTLRSTVTAKDSDQAYVRIGGEILDLAPGLAPYNPIDTGNPGDLTQFRDSVGSVVYYRIHGQADAGTVYGGPQCYDRSNLGSAVVPAGAVADGEYGIVKVTILPGLSSYTAVPGFGGRDSQAEPNPDAGSVSYTVELVSP
jgi:hypothetical protein